MAFPVRTRLKSARVREGMTQQQVADKAGVPRAIVQEWENKRHVPRGEQAAKVARVLGLDLDDMLHDFSLQRVPREKEPVDKKTEKT